MKLWWRGGDGCGWSGASREMAVVAALVGCVVGARWQMARVLLKLKTKTTDRNKNQKQL